MQIFDVFSMNGIENIRAVGEFFKKMLFLRSHRHTFPRISTPRGGAYIFQGGGQCSPLRGAVKYPAGGSSSSFLEIEFLIVSD